jgi:hypothetical protein
MTVTIVDLGVFILLGPPTVILSSSLNRNLF